MKGAERRSLEDIENAVEHVVTIIVMCTGAVIAIVAVIVLICITFSLFR